MWFRKKTEPGQESTVSVDEWAIKHGFKKSSVIKFLEEGIIDGFKKDGFWYVTGDNKLFFRSISKKNKLSDLLKEIFSPRYDEITLFVMSSTILILFLADIHFRSAAINFFLDDPGFRSYIGALFLFFGFATSLLQGFYTHKKTEFEREMMLLFAIIFQGGSGIIAGFYIFENNIQVLHWFFPLWNIVSGISLITMYRFDLIGIEAIIDTNLCKSQMLFAFVLLLILILTLLFVLQYHWSIIMSASIVFAGAISSFVDSKSVKKLPLF